MFVLLTKQTYQWQEDDGCEIFNPVHDGGGIGGPRDNEASQETTFTDHVSKRKSLNTCHARTKKWMHPDNISEESSGEDHQQCEYHHGSGGSFLKFGPLYQPSVYISYRIYHEQDKPSTGEQHIQRCEAISCVDEGRCQCKQNPTKNIIAYTSREGNNSDGCIPKFCFSENTTQHWESCYSDRNSREQDEVAEVNDRVHEVHVNSKTQRCAQAQWHEESRSKNSNGCPDVSFDDVDVDLQADNEQEDNKTDRACQVKERD